MLTLALKQASTNAILKSTIRAEIYRHLYSTQAEPVSTHLSLNSGFKMGC